MEITFSLKEIDDALIWINETAKKFSTWTFTGDMGVGKTTLIKKICSLKGVVDVVSSPTFSIINEYHTEEGEKIFHLDLYRLKDEEEAIQAGVEEVLQSGNLCLVEWPSIAENLFPENTIHFVVELVEGEVRRIRKNR